MDVGGHLFSYSPSDGVPLYPQAFSFFSLYLFIPTFSSTSIFVKELSPRSLQHVALYQRFHKIYGFILSPNRFEITF